MRSIKITLIMLLLAVAASLAALIYTGEERQSILSRSPERGVVVINMTTRNWRFDPVVVQGHDGVEAWSKSRSEVFADTVIKVRLGDTVIINIENVEPNQPHGFGLEEFGITSVVTPPRQVVTVRFVASKEGTYIFFCTVFCGTGHPLHRGTLIVSGG